MGYRDEKLWEILEKKVELEDNKLPKDRQIRHKYLSAVEDVCDFGVDLALTIRDTFPMYTLHDETHICNVLRLMADLLGDRIDDLTRDETAMLIMAACCHDIGMSYREEDIKELLEDYDRINKYLEKNRREYVKAYAGRTDKPVMTDDMIQNCLRSIHHERVKELLSRADWNQVLSGKVNRKDLVRVCQTHGMDISSLNDLEATSTIDLRLCAVLLRLADILDFDTSRAPRAVYEYSGFDKKEGDNARISKEEWEKHLSSLGFDFEHIIDRSNPYLLGYNAESKSIQVQQIINSYLDWVDQELENCRRQLARYTGKWQNLVLPMKIKRNIENNGYVAEPYRLTLNHSKVMELLVGKDLYADPAVFVRELLQNAIDAVRTREKMDKDLPSSWKPQINIRTWIDEEGYNWFRIEDNGTGMSEEIIKDYLLKVGSSYYTSDLFEQDKIRCKVEPDYTPISRFGIGLLSCFMGDEGTNQVEISTKRFQDGLGVHSALRLSLHGIDGFYYMAKKEENHNPGLMKGVTPEEKQPFLKQAGTVIAVRTNLYLSGAYKGFKEIIDQYVFFPQVLIHYDGEEGSYDYPTEEEFINSMCNIQSIRDMKHGGQHYIPIPLNQFQEIADDIPDFLNISYPPVAIYCIVLNQFTSSPYISGAILLADFKEETIYVPLFWGRRKVTIGIFTSIGINDSNDELIMNAKMRIPSALEDDIRVLRATYFDFLYGNKEYDLNTDEKGIGDMWGSNQEIEEIITQYDAIKKGYKISICRLWEYDWYQKFFQNASLKTGKKNIVAYNGIICGNSDFFFKTDYYNLCTLLLLKDKFQPSVDISRDEIRHVSLDMVSEIDAIIMRINSDNENQFLKDSSKMYMEKEYPYLPAQECWNFLENHKYIVDNFTFLEDDYIRVKNITVDQINSMLKYGIPISIYVQESNFLSEDYMVQWETIQTYLKYAYLRKKYILQRSFTVSGVHISITGKGCDMHNDHKNILPALFFLCSTRDDDRYLTTRLIPFRCPCNANHRFSKFILKNCCELKKNAAGALREILHVIVEDEYLDVIKKINCILTHLCKICNNSFNITDDLYLTEEDFI